MFGLSQWRRDGFNQSRRVETRYILQGIDNEWCGGSVQLRVGGMRGIYAFCLAVIYMFELHGGCLTIVRAERWNKNSRP
jgi:hypothetical protein